MEYSDFRQIMGFELLGIMVSHCFFDDFRKEIDN